MDDKDRMKQGFQMLLEIGLDVDDEEKYIPTSVSDITETLREYVLFILKTHGIVKDHGLFITQLSI